LNENIEVFPKKQKLKRSKTAWAENVEI